LSLTLGLGLASSNVLAALLFEPLAIGAACLIGSGIAALASNRPPTALACGLLALWTAALALGAAARAETSDVDIRTLLSRQEVPLGSLVHFDGCVVEEPRRRAGDIILMVDLHGIREGDRWKRCRGRVLLRAPEHEPAPIPISSGDRLRAWAEWSPPRNFMNPGAHDRAAFLARRGIRLTGRIRTLKLAEILPRDCSHPLALAASSARTALRSSLLDPVRITSPAAGGLLASILIGDSWDLDSSTRETFQNSGVYHVLVVSGLHVAWIAGALYYVLARLRIPDRVTHATIGACVAAFAAVVGFQASVSRALSILLLVILGRLLFRTGNPLNLLFAGVFLILLVAPEWLGDLGFQLSVLSASAILLQALPWIDGTLRPLLAPLRCAGTEDRLFFDLDRWARLGRRWRTRIELIAECLEDRLHPRAAPVVLVGSRVLARLLFLLGAMVAVSISVQIWLGPLLIYQFNRMSWVSPLANLLVVPLASLMLAAGALGAAATLLPAPLTFVHDLLITIGRLLLAATEWSASLPGAWQRCPSPPLMMVVIPLAALGVACFFGWRLQRTISLATVLLLLILCPAAPRLAPLHFSRESMSSGGMQPVSVPLAAEGLLRITFLDVGQGDSIVVRFPDSRIWVLDAGGMRDAGEEPAFDIGEAVVSRYLWSQRIYRVDRVLLSHPHQDHAGGLPAVMSNFFPRGFDFSEPFADATLSRMLTAASTRGIDCRRMVAGAERVVSGVFIRFLNPPAAPSTRSINDNSMVLHLAYGGFTALLTGDLEKIGEHEVLNRLPEHPISVLKVAHHGSRTATLAPFLQRTRPRWAVISAGRNNPFGHPARETLVRLLRSGSRPLQTFELGAIEFETDGRHYRVSSFVCGLMEEGVLN
jgi:competence protein ComEC